jgi:DNA-binding SARP family transcriptional activator
MLPLLRGEYSQRVLDRNERLRSLLQDALGIAEEGADGALLRHLSAARRSIQGFTEPDRTITVDLLTGRVGVRGVRAPMSKGEFAVIAALSRTERGVARDVLAEELYPHVDAARAANTTKVFIYRARRRLASRDVICCRDGRYVLGDMVDVEVIRLEAEVRRLQVENVSLSTPLRERLERIQRRLSAGRPQFMLDWGWFEEMERRLCDLTRSVTMLLAYDALRRGDHVRAMSCACDLVRDDPLDEAATEVAIRACLSTGNRAGAIIEYSRYDGILRREIGSRPSHHLRTLIESATLTA